ncbi:MAG TPA: HAD hydrolase family protein [Vicinamibacterales bacterium]|nr:HAD hydrolase family protein [Vicinamibacterales bacterium]
MKLSAIALDYDGTIAHNNVMDPSVRMAIAEARDAGIAVILATGRRLDDLRRVAGDLAFTISRAGSTASSETASSPRAFAPTRRPSKWRRSRTSSRT